MSPSRSLGVSALADTCFWPSETNSSTPARWRPIDLNAPGDGAQGFTVPTNTEVDPPGGKNA
ncbi:hypothetical protein GCM10009802_15370 [Streptomyces synnematoformans]|uniref:Uncharacterized protein n=1 Tax=Streptomyces synnematoformans TaxID=415721 RepID=A0ABN2XRE1_9ACTN